MRKITCSIILCFSIFLFLTNSAFAEDQVMAMEKPILQFPVISDVHIGGYGAQERGFEHALKTYKQLAPNYQAIAIVGDLTQSGQPFEYDGFNQILNYFSLPSAEKIITMGNHEFFEGRYWPKPEHTEQYFIDRFIDKTKMPGLYYDKWIEGYHFIVLGGEESRITNPSNGDDAIISDAQYKWLQEKLKENADPSKPIFVFLHQPINETVYGSDEWGSELEKLNEILRQYPQVIFFTGHSHNLLNHPRTVFQNEFTMVNTGAVAYGWVDAGNSFGLSQGLLVNVFENKVEIKTRDFTKNKWLDSYTIQIPFKKTIDETIPPYFVNEDVTVDDIKETQVKLTWNVALDNETLVDRYYIKLDDKILKTEYTEFWNPTTLPREISTILSNLESGTTYTMELVAIDAWKNASKPVTFSFKTKDYNGWWFLDNTWYYFESNIKRQGWLLDDGYWYYLAPDGAMQTGWIEENGVEYYLDKSGAMQTGWLEIDKKQYYFNENGTKQTGWKYLNGAWYYLGQ
ncbi:metallophosphoesterase, partial [Bacillus sp. JJ1566]|uniref:metallophosphoesterase n=1 Tax=Bacillus sp. JJ1566 TaxID=3122961 RepID=UPI002FFE8BFA